MGTNGTWSKNFQQLNNIPLSYFQILFASKGALLHVLNNIQISSISHNDFLSLSKPFTAEGIKKTVCSLGAWNAPGPDGILMGFYKEHWTLIGDNITTLALNFLEGKNNLHQLNHTDFVLIPKTKNPQKPEDFRPIGLCNTVYKIISKTLINRLSQNLSKVIDKNHGTFLTNRGLLQQP